ncbi:hypothetical protein [Caldalkalibacillus salinus]|uniref:hypothetical protein n=1 Tax=Caldalkalibacillus salinus TaxID=2803787 RepID=UPI001923DBAF|nr:hypothetical protein [Caldalkalibacillus salinus]
MKLQRKKNNGQQTVQNRKELNKQLNKIVTFVTVLVFVVIVTSGCSLLNLGAENSSQVTTEGMTFNEKIQWSETINNLDFEVTSTTNDWPIEVTASVTNQSAQSVPYFIGSSTEGCETDLYIEAIHVESDTALVTERKDGASECTEDVVSDDLESGDTISRTFLLYSNAIEGRPVPAGEYNIIASFQHVGAPIVSAEKYVLNTGDAHQSQAEELDQEQDGTHQSPSSENEGISKDLDEDVSWRDRLKRSAVLFEYQPVFELEETVTRVEEPVDILREKDLQGDSFVLFQYQSPSEETETQSESDQAHSEDPNQIYLGAKGENGELYRYLSVSRAGFLDSIELKRDIVMGTAYIVVSGLYHEDYMQTKVIRTDGETMHYMILDGHLTVTDVDDDDRDEWVTRHGNGPITTVYKWREGQLEYLVVNDWVEHFTVVYQGKGVFEAYTQGLSDAVEQFKLEGHRLVQLEIEEEEEEEEDQQGEEEARANVEYDE